MKFDIRHSLLLSLGLLSFTAVAADVPQEPYVNDAPLSPPFSSSFNQHPFWNTDTKPTSFSAPHDLTISHRASRLISSTDVDGPPSHNNIGGVGGGFFTVAGSSAGPVAVAAGASTVAGSSQGDSPDDPENKPPSSAPEAPSAPPSSAPPSSAPPSSAPPSSTSEAPTSTSSALPSETPKACIVFCKDGATTQEKTSFITLLDTVLGKGNYRKTEDTVVLFAAANITASQNSTLIKDPTVAGVELDQLYDTDDRPGSLVPNSKRAEDVDEKWFMESLDRRGEIKKRAVVKQDKAPVELIMFSQPPLVDIKALTSYSYDDSAGAGITVYVLDSGYYTKNSEYTGMAVKPRWIFAGTQAEKSVEEDRDSDGHGSCAGSKVNGPKYGVAKKAELVIVKAGDTSGDTLDGLDQILRDVRDKKLQNKAVVNFSRNIDNPNSFNKKMLQHYVNELIKEDVVFITAAGNDNSDDVAAGKAKAKDVDAWPSMMAADGVPIINVGATDNTGKNASFSQGGPLVHVMAPGEQIQCAANSFFSNTQKQDGTSFAAPSVAGLAAYLLALGEYPQLYQSGKVAANMKDLLIAMAYQRVPDGGQVVFNGQGAVCARPNSAKFRRQDLSGEACSVVASTTTIPPPVSTTAPPPPPPPATTSEPPATTSAPPPPPPAPKTLYSLDESIGGGTKSCFPTSGFTTSAGTTYGFSFDVDANLLVSIETGATDEGYHQSMGSWTGTFYADSGSSLSICGQSSGGALPLKFTITEAPSEAVKAPAGKEVLKMDENLTAGATSCFPTTGLNIQQGNYGFSYTTSDGVVIQIGDDSSGPKYFSGNKASGAGLMYIDFSGGSISVCATNNGGGPAALSLSMTQ
ncbi:Subtilisin-like protease 2 [Colletotrichum siamense]|uniref:Subtilisin-like protease 2 n=1 Tax=Colletotrichum siamense TaxID=690259 RepID=UPI0018723221|nr:Subtilisin-like protease 2 [Colletotrichum siamense]KAF5494539.1 Subtilisin-like protease 2 [Colletotrichum siamense]